MSSSKLTIPVATVDPDPDPNGVQLYAKDVAGVKQIFMRASDGTITQLGGGGGGGGDFEETIRVATAFGGNFATVHSWTPPGYVASTQVVVIESQDGGTQGIGGLTGGVDGRVVTIMKVLPGYPGDVPYSQGLFFVTEDPGSTDIDRFAANQGNTSFAQRPSGMTFRYDGVINRWVPLCLGVSNS